MVEPTPVVADEPDDIVRIGEALHEQQQLIDTDPREVDSVATPLVGDDDDGAVHQLGPENVIDRDARIEIGRAGDLLADCVALATGIEEGVEIVEEQALGG